MRHTLAMQVGEQFDNAPGQRGRDAARRRSWDTRLGEKRSQRRCQEFPKLAPRYEIVEVEETPLVLKSQMQVRDAGVWREEEAKMLLLWHTQKIRESQLGR